MMCAAGYIRGMYLGQIRLHLKTNLSQGLSEAMKSLAVSELANSADFENDRDVGKE